MQPLDAIREVLLGWDPYANHDGFEPSLYSYQTFDESIAAQLRRRATVVGLTAYLTRMRVDRLGLSPNHAQDRVIAGRLAALPRSPASLDLTAAERRLLRQGLMQWGGPTVGEEMVTRLLGLPNVPALYACARDLAQRLDLDEPLDADDRRTALLLTELCFISDVAGAGTDRNARLSDDDAEDETTLQCLRQLQHMLRTLPPVPRPRRPHRPTEARLRVHGSRLVPADVTRLLRLPPDHVHHAGEPRRTLGPSGTVREGPPYPSTMWALSTKGRVTSNDPASHVRWVLRLLEPRADAVRSLASTHQVDIFCYRPDAYLLEPDATQLAGMGLVLQLGGDAHQ